MEWTSTHFIVLGIFIAIGAGVYLFQQRQKMQKDTSFYTYTKDLTESARKDELDPVSGRDEEIERMIHVLKRRSKNNPLLIGNPGVGKTAIVEGLAQDMIKGNVPKEIAEKRLLSLDLTSLMSGTKYRGELETRLQSMLKELESIEGNAILFIDEIHLIEEMGNSEGAMNIKDILKPALSRGELQVIGATTWDEYKKFIQPDQALDRRFQPVLVDEPNPKEALSILKSIRGEYEEFHGVKITDKALEAAVNLSDKKIDSRYLPDKAIDLMDEASAKVSIEATKRRKTAMGVVHAASKGKEGIVDVKDIEEIVEQWVIHSKEEKKRDARV